jgi:hypothetical protein
MTHENDKESAQNAAQEIISKALNIAQIIVTQTPKVSGSGSSPPLPIPINGALLEQHPTLNELRLLKLLSVAPTQFRHTPNGNTTDISAYTAVSGYCFMAENAAGNWAGYVGVISGKPILSLTYIKSTANGCPHEILLDYDEELNPQLEINYTHYTLSYS